MMQSTVDIGARDTTTRRLRRLRATLGAPDEGQLNTLAGLDLTGLRRAWEKAMEQEASLGLGRDFLMRYLAYRLQVQAHGDIDRRTKGALERIANGDFGPLEAYRGPGANLKPGAVLVREYKGDTHQVTVLAEGYAWRGQTYATLSAVARAITQTNWNGYVFFGLRQATSREADNG